MGLVQYRVMNLTDDPLWSKLEAFELDVSGDSLTFTRRLARENGWSPDFAGRVVEEYRRFLFVAMRAGHPVTPSDEVDQAWHLHLVYTHSYWDELCGEVLGRPLHHGPTRGGRAEDDKYHDWYEKTLASYERVFARTPPADIWPEARQRFSSEMRWRRVNVASCWLLPKSKVKRVAALLVGGTCLGGLLAACSGEDAENSILALIIVGVLTLILILAASASKKAKSGKGSNDSHGCTSPSSGCSGCSSRGHDSSHHSHDSSDSIDSSSGDSSSGCSSSGCGGGACGGGGGD